MLVFALMHPNIGGGMSLTRQQFEDELNFRFNSLLFSTPDALKSLMTNNKAAMNVYLTNILRAQSKINEYLSAWDAAPNQAAKNAVVAGVTYDFGNANVNPENGVLWPDSGGRFGNIKGPSSSSVGNLATFASTSGQVATDGGPAPSRSQSLASRTLNNVYQISATKDCIVNYSVDVSCTLSLNGGQIGTVFLEIAPNSSFTTGVQEVCRFANGNTGNVSPTSNITQLCTGGVNGYVPAGYYVRIRTANTTGTPTFTYRIGQEVLL